MPESTPPHSHTGLELEQFRVHAPLEIERVLRDLVKSHELVTAYFNGGQEFILTALLAVDMEHKHLVLDSAADERLNQRLLEAGRVVCATRHHKVRVQFSSDRISAGHYQGGPAFLVPLPESIIRIQRREHYRLSAPIGQRLNLSLPGSDGGRIHAQVLDLSLGGVGILEPATGLELDWTPGTRIDGCQLELPEAGALAVDLEIRNRITKTVQGVEVYRLGCRLLALDARRSTLLQRYIHRMEAERLRIRHD